eukprot:c17571_g1_i1 orf=193-351(-)
MALLCLAHQQNIGCFKGLNVEGAQICLKDSSSRKLSDIIVNLDPVEEEVMEV